MKKIGKRIFSSVTAICFALQISGCENWGENSTEVAFGSFLKQLEKRQAGQPTEDLKLAQQLKITLKSAKEVLGADFRLGEVAPIEPTSADAYVQKYTPAVQAYLQSLEAGSEGLRRVIFESSRVATFSADPSVAANLQAVTYFALEFQREYHRKAAELVSPFLAYTAAADVRDIESVKNLNKIATQAYFRHFGAQMVTKADKKKVLAKLRDAKTAGQLPDFTEQSVNQSQQALAQQAKKGTEDLQTALSHMSPADQAKLKGQMEDIVKEFGTVSFLYSPEKNFNTAVNILIVIGNLTWGLINTLIGAGIIVWDVALAIVGVAQFPQFAVAANGHMIYVNVTGANPLGIGGKLSMGLFELDNGAGYEWMSGHEGVHGLQSALLGPFYLPTVLFSYVISGFDQGFMEEWADAWADL